MESSPAPQPPPPRTPSPPSPSSSFLLMPPKFEGAKDERPPNSDEENPRAFPQFQILNSMEYLEKYRKYEEDYSRRLITKYFSDKNLYGVDVYDEKIAIDDELILASRWPCTKSFVGPLKPLKKQKTSGSPSTSES